MSKLSVNISDDPISGYERKVEVLNNEHIYDEESVTDICLQIFYHKPDGSRVDLDPVININKRFNPFIVKLSAAGNMVNPTTGDTADKVYYDGELDEDGNTTGEIVPEGDPTVKSFKYEDGSVREYDYFSALSPTMLGLTADASILEIMNAVYTSTILKKDAEGRFN